MTDLGRTETGSKEQLWIALSEIHAGMLMIAGANEHPQPMAPQLDKQEKSIWFFTNRNSDLNQSIQAKALARFLIVGEDHDYYASIVGSISEESSAAKIDEFWNPVVAAWFAEGREDSDVVLLKLNPTEAAVWASTGNPLKFAWEIAKANLGDDQPDVGIHTFIKF